MILESLKTDDEVALLMGRTEQPLGSYPQRRSE